MQIVRDLGGYTLGRSDLVRRAMSKKKQSVMEKEKANFIYGNKEENVPGCINKGIDEQTAEQIYEDMMDFAKYAFNKSHAACYAVVAYQTAYLKYYYPVEFMAALLTSVIDNTKKVSEYILTCRNMGIEILPPDINEGESGFSVSGNRIRYALTAIKSVGRPAIESIEQERKEGGKFANLKDFITRIVNKEINRRGIENFIKAGAMDSLGGTRKQFLSVYPQILDHIVKDKKKNLAGQISLFDIVGEEEKQEFDIKMPQIGEYDKETLLSFEKEVLGIYISGHPMEEYQELWNKYITNTTNDFSIDEETGTVKVCEQATAVIGGIIAEKTIKYTKNDKRMAFLNIEDLVGNVEVVIFPKDYERFGSMLTEDTKVFIKGKVSIEEDRDGKLICEQIVSFEEAQKNGVSFLNRYHYNKTKNNSYKDNNKNTQGEEEKAKIESNVSYYKSNDIKTSEAAKTDAPVKKLPEGVWIQFADIAAFQKSEQKLYSVIANSKGNDDVIIFLKNTKSMKKLSSDYCVCADEALQNRLFQVFGKENVKFVTKPIENRKKID